jgi:PAS domain S-box-containing protein
MKHYLRQHIIFLQLIFIPFFTFAQIDSLENRLQYAEGDEKFELLLIVSKEYWFKNPMKSVEYATAALKMGAGSGNDIQKAKALNRIANGYYFLEQYKLALEYYIKSLELSELTGYKEGIANATNNIGLIYNVLGDYDMAIEYYLKSLEIVKSENDKSGVGNTSVNIGNIYYYLKNYEKALFYFHQSLNIFSELKIDEGILDIYNSIGSTYADLNNFDSALYYYNKAYQLSVGQNNLSVQANSLNNLGTIYFDKKKYNKALEYYNSALIIELGQDDLWAQANTIRNIGDVYLFLNEYDKSFAYFSRAEEIAKNIGAKRLLMDIYSSLANYYEKKKDFEKAYASYKSSTILKDSIYNEESINKIAEFESKYTLRTKDQQLQIITKENKLQVLQIRTQRYIIYSVASFSLFILALFFVFYSRARINKKAKKHLEEKNIKITDQKILLEKAISELKESEEKHVSLIKNIQDGIFVIQDEKMRFANESFSKITGYPLEAIYDLDFRDLIHPDDLEVIETNYRKRLAGENVPGSYEFRIIHKRGRVVHLSLSVGVTNYLGKPAHIGTIKDITQLKKHENELIKRKEKAEQSTQSKSMFLAGMSHEIRNHMHSIIGITEVLAETKLTPEQKEYFEIINTSGNDLMNIINEILDFSKIEAGQVILELAEINIREIVSKVILMFEIKAQQIGLYLKSDIEDSIPEKLTGDPTRLTQILINFLNNALKFTDKGGITIKVSQTSEPYPLSVDDANTCFVKFEVIDTGIGISEDSQDKLFKPFSQTHAAVQRKQGGTGLGLAICKQLVELMNGQIGVTSQIDKGSNFWFIVQFLNPQLKIQTPSDNKLENLVTKNRNIKILVVEDNLLNQQLLVNILIKEGYIVDMAENGRIGVDLFKKNRYNVVLMDIQMPIMDGIQATRIIREYETKNKRRKSVIVAVTAHTKEGEQQKLFDAGMDIYLSKPFKTLQLTNLLNELNLS